MVGSEYKYHTLGSRMGRERKRQAYRSWCSSIAKRPSLDEQRAAQFTLWSPLGKKDRGQGKEQISRGKGRTGRCCRTSRTRAAAGQGSVEGGAQTDLLESEWRRWVAVPKERELLLCGRCLETVTETDCTPEYIIKLSNCLKKK